MRKMCINLNLKFFDDDGSDGGGEFIAGIYMLALTSLRYLVRSIL